MKTNKNFKHNINYFKRSEFLSYLGIGLMILSAFLFFFGWGYLSYIIMCTGLPVGFLLFLLSSTGRSNESDIDAYIKRKTENIGLDTENDKSFEKKLLKNIPIESAEGYEYRQGLMLRKGKNGGLRSSEYTKAVLYPLDSAICICYRTVSLVSDECVENCVQISYSDIKSFKMTEEEQQLTFGKNAFRAKACRLLVEYADTESISLPIQDNIKTDAFVQKINELIMKSRSSDER